ncbi:hypothetical protein M0811_14636 [Anaeramoeba ignava]|uniref:Uncharacterized protein n=1 Tax=Anaeramoeba ignava TaxID=1746090 RepID=A0A9Q0LUT7_ANAIG|nr:hypothetical protein M0811_14636 [Anaeramoeba ignava]
MNRNQKLDEENESKSSKESFNQKRIKQLKSISNDQKFQQIIESILDSPLIYVPKKRERFSSSKFSNNISKFSQLVVDKMNNEIFQKKRIVYISIFVTMIKLIIGDTLAKIENLINFKSRTNIKILACNPYIKD